MKDPNSLMKKFGYVAVFVFVFLAGLGVGRLLPNGSAIGSLYTAFSSRVDNGVDMTMFWSVWNTMKDQYVDEKKTDTESMLYGAIKGVVNSYEDAATVYLDPTETKEFNDSNAGKAFSGIGAELGYSMGQIIVVAPIDGSPAQKAGIRAGDAILKVDGVDIKPSDSIYDVVLKIRGEAGTEVTLTVLQKGGSALKEIKIVRGEIDLPSIEVKDIKGYSQYKLIDVSRFTDSSSAEWKRNWDIAVSEVIKSNAQGVVIDLRGNPGGYLDSAIYAAEEFLPKGSVSAKQQDRDGDEYSYKVKRVGKLLNMPVIVLINGSSASASEILAGALQKNDRAKIVGENSYGKGTAQSIVPFSDGSSLHITTLKWLLPDGTWINHDNTIVPNTTVKYSEDDFKKGIDNQLMEAVKQLK